MTRVSQISMRETVDTRATVSAEATNPASHQGDAMARKRYQRGALRREGKLWVLRWREDVLNQAGAVVRVERRARVGPVKDLPTKALARRVADRMIEHVNEPDYRPGMVVTVEQFAEIYEREAAPNFTPSAEKTVQSVSRTYIVPILGKYRLDEVTGRVPQLLINALQQRGKAQKTIKNALSQLSAMLKTARGWGYIAQKLDWETLFIPTEDVEKEVRCFTPDEAQRIIDQAPEPFNVCFSLMAYPGLRAGEALGVTWANVDFEGAVLRVRQSAWCGRIKTVKAKASRRDLPLPDALASMLADYRRRWRPNDQGLLFTNQKGGAFGADYVRR
jgi:integrase